VLRQLRGEPAEGGEPVLAAVHGQPRLRGADLRRQRLELLGRDIGQVREHDVERLGDRLEQVAGEQHHALERAQPVAVARGPRQSLGRRIGGEHLRRRRVPGDGERAPVRILGLEDVVRAPFPLLFADTDSKPGLHRRKGRLVRLRLEAVGERLHAALWFIPTLGLITALVLSEALPSLDRALKLREDGGAFLTAGVAESARGSLEVIATSTLTVTGVIFSVTMLVLQLAENQLSPRVMRTFLRDRMTQLVLALFTATFTYALLIVRHVGPAEDEEFVPLISVWFAFLLVVLTIGMLIFYIHHMAQSIRAGWVIHSVSLETHKVIDRLYPKQEREGHEAIDARWPDDPPDAVVRSPFPSGVVVQVDDGALLRLAQRHACRVALVPHVGDFVRTGGELLYVWGEFGEEVDAREVTSTVSVGLERTMQQDVLFGIRQLVDIAERALSPSLNDPTTAVQVIDHLHDLLAEIAQRSAPSAYRLDEDGEPRVRIPQPSWGDALAIAVDEIRHYGGHSIQITRRLRSMLEDLLALAAPLEAAAVHRQLDLLDESVRRGFEAAADRDSAARPSRQGHGPR
jgi:uncharacterized membrane protein